MELTKDVQKKIIEGKLQQWQQSQFSLELDAKVAKTLDDENMMNRVKDELKRALGALQILQEELEKLDNPNNK